MTTPETRLLIIDPASAQLRSGHAHELAELLRAGDLLVVNDAATLPASLHARTAQAEPIELRLLAPPDADGTCRALLLGAGDYHTLTEQRPPPPPVRVGERLRIARDCSLQVVGHSTLSTRLLDVRFEAHGAALWTQLYAWGKPVQYAHQHAPLPLWSVQTIYAARPWASEMPSAGRPLTMRTLVRLKQRGVQLATLTHAAGLSSTGDPALDCVLPLPERYDLPAATIAAIERTRESAGRVIAVGTSVVRALESAWLRGDGRLAAGEAVATLRIGPEHRPRVVSGLLTGVHSPEESHFALLAAFMPARLLARSSAYALELGYRQHEFGDASLILPGVLGAPLPSAQRVPALPLGAA